MRIAQPTPDDLLRVVRAHGVSDERLLAALKEVPRAAYAPPELADRAYADIPLPIPHGQVTTQPSLVAMMVEALGLRGGERVLEVGTGYGFQTALLARLAADVWSVERWPDIAKVARENLERQRVRNAHVVVGDGSDGFPGQGPYDAIVVSAAFPEVPDPIARQLAPRGRLVQPLGEGGAEKVVVFERAPEGLEPRGFVTGARFVRLVGRHGFEG